MYTATVAGSRDVRFVEKEGVPPPVFAGQDYYVSRYTRVNDEEAGRVPHARPARPVEGVDEER
jgi:hypothetical protein